MKMGMWKIGFGHKRYGDNYTSVRVLARTGDDAIKKARAKEKSDDKKQLYVDNVSLISRAD